MNRPSRIFADVTGAKENVESSKNRRQFGSRRERRSLFINEKEVLIY